MRSLRACVKLLEVKTIVTTSPLQAAEFIGNSGSVAFPTETVYGLGANVFDESGIAKIFEAKRRPADNPLIAHISNLGHIHQLTSSINENAWRFIDQFFPGPLTLVLPKSDKVPLTATAGLDTIGVRMPRHGLARSFIAACGVPLVAPSANLSGRPSPTTWQAVLEDLDGRIDCILQGEATEIGLESTVVDCTSEVPVLLRQGAVSLAKLQEVVGETIVDREPSSLVPRSPGLTHKHYSPRAAVILVAGPKLGRPLDDSDRGLAARALDSLEIRTPGSLSFPVLTRNAAFIGIKKIKQDVALARVCGSIEEYAHSLFEFFRECDRRKIETIYCEEVAETGIGAALMDRLRRAAESDTAI